MLKYSRIIDEVADSNPIRAIRPGDIVMFNLPQKNPTYFGKLVLRFQNIVTISNNRKTHAAMVVDPGGEQARNDEMHLKVIDIEFGRKVSTYFVPRKYGDIDIYRPFNSMLSCSFSDGRSTVIDTEKISERAVEIALELQGASYSLSNCLHAIDTHKKNEEHLINEDYLERLKKTDSKDTFMCVSFVLTCYQKACLELLGGLPPAFNINAYTTPRYFAHHIERSGHFTTLPRSLIAEILTTGDKVYRKPPAQSRFSWLWRARDPKGYEPLIAAASHDDFSQENEDKDEGAGLGVF